MLILIDIAEVSLQRRPRHGQMARKQRDGIRSKNASGSEDASDGQVLP
jgi:hypothetical protein